MREFGHSDLARVTEQLTDRAIRLRPTTAVTMRLPTDTRIILTGVRQSTLADAGVTAAAGNNFSD